MPFSRTLKLLSLPCVLFFAASAAGQMQPGRLDAPSVQEQAAAADLVREAYKSEYARATNPDTKRALANKLLADAAETKDDAAARYVMMRTARELAVQVGDLAITRKAIDALSAGFVVDKRLLLADVIEKLGNTAALTELPDFVAMSVELSTALAETNHYEEAERAAAAALDAARKSKDKELMKRATTARDAVAGEAKQFAPLKEAFAKLKSAPADPAANAAVGRFLFFVKGDGKRGLPMLALGDDMALAKLAAADLQAETPDAKVAAGDAWLKHAASLVEEEQLPARRRAYELYQASVDKLTGITAKRIAQRLDELELSFPAPLPERPGVLEKFPEHFMGTFSPNGRYFAVSSRAGSVQVFYLQSKRRARQLKVSSGNVHVINYLPDGEKLLTLGSDKQARLWDVATGGEIRSFDVALVADRGWIESEGKRCYVEHSAQLRAYDIASGKEIKHWDCRAGDQVDVQGLSPDGRYAIASGISNTVRIFDLARGGNISFDGGTHCYGSNLSADGRLALTGGGDNLVRVWNVATKKPIATFRGHEAHVYRVRFMPDGKRVISCGADGRTILWDGKTGEALFSVNCEMGGLNAIEVSPNARYALVRGDRGVVLLALPE